MEKRPEKHCRKMGFRSPGWCLPGEECGGHGHGNVQAPLTTHCLPTPNRARDNTTERALIHGAPLTASTEPGLFWNSSSGNVCSRFRLSRLEKRRGGDVGSGQAVQETQKTFQKHGIQQRAQHSNPNVSLCNPGSHLLWASVSSSVKWEIHHPTLGRIRIEHLKAPQWRTWHVLTVSKKSIFPSIIPLHAHHYLHFRFPSPCIMYLALIQMLNVCELIPDYPWNVRYTLMGQNWPQGSDSLLLSSTFGSRMIQQFYCFRYFFKLKISL